MKIWKTKIQERYNIFLRYNISKLNFKSTNKKKRWSWGFEEGNACPNLVEKL